MCHIPVHVTYQLGASPLAVRLSSCNLYHWLIFKIMIVEDIRQPSVWVCGVHILDVVKVFWDAKLFVNLGLFHPKLVLTPGLHCKHILCRGK